jgi:hypothetical protein
MPEADQSNIPVHISAEEWLLRGATREEIEARHEARQRRENPPADVPQPVSLPPVRGPAPPPQH